MEDAKHTPEFGRASSTKNNVEFAETDDLPRITAQVMGGNKDVNRLYARRIVSCVNALAEVEKQRDELLAAVIVLRERHQIDDPHHADLCEFCRQADAAIAKATRGAQ